MTCGNSLIAQGVDMIVLTGIDPSTIPSVVLAAKAKKIPIVDFGGTVGPGYDLQMAPDEVKAGKVLASYLKAKLDSPVGRLEHPLDRLPGSWAQQRTAQLKATRRARPEAEDLGVGDERPDQPDRRHPEDRQRRADRRPEPEGDLGRVRHGRPGGGPDGGEQFAGKTFPDKPLVVTFHADPSTQSLMRTHAIDAVVDVNYDATAWEMADAVAEHFARGKPLPKYGTSFKYPGIGDPLAYQIVTGGEPAPANTYVAPKVDTVTYFITKWKTEGFGK